MSKSILCGVKYLSSNRVSRCGILECEDGEGLRTISEWRYRDRAADISSNHSQQSYSSVDRLLTSGCHVLVCLLASGDDLRVTKNWGNRDSISGCLIIIILLLFITESWSLLGVYFSEQRYGTGQHSPAES